MRPDLRATASDDTAIPTTVWDIHDVAAFLRCSTKTIRVLVRREGLPCFKLRSRLTFVPCDVLAWGRRRGSEGR